MNIKNRITLFSTVWLLIILLVTNGSIYFVFQQIQRENALERIEMQMNSMIEAIQESPEEVEIQPLLRAYLPSDSMIRVISEKREEPFFRTPSPFEELPMEFHPNERSELKTYNGHLYTVAYHPIIWENGEVVSLELTEEQSSIQNTMRVLQIVLTVATLVIFIPSFLGGRVLSRLILNPIRSMIQTMEEIQKRGTFKKIHIEPTTNDELTKMATTFNHMMDLLEANYKKQEQFVSDASHELKTPLTVIESYAKMLKRWGKQKPEVLEEAIEAIHAESLRMRELTTQMLQLAKDQSQFDLNYERVDVIGLSKEAGRNMQNAYHRVIHVLSEQEELPIEGDPQKLKQVLFILLDNAIKYSNEEITIVISATASSVKIAVKDKGIGIPVDDLEKVYDRFYRVDKARSRETGGSGLGLSIARRIAHAHHGGVELTSEEGNGTTATLELPKHPQY
ncbi:sensor histidine kinase [Shouchella shacheensis]|uniref:sensor histidine kinase n=1 Tax=Shouchella shacheensis TaxID=1649580 RepID=UPI000740013A|nr:ATP-binding protein [Shouchella shacheensis]